MRVALISIAGQPRDAARHAPLAVAGKTLARRQLDFVLAAACERVIALGDGTSAEAIALRHVAEGAGARFDVVRDSHGVLGAVRATDELLALSPGLLPDAADMVESLANGGRVLVLPASLGVAVGFERIDSDRAWAGAVVVPGAKVERLSGLAADIEPASALMRIALQARTAELRLTDEALAHGTWSMVAEGAETGPLEQAWLKRHVPPARPWAPAEAMAALTVRSLGTGLLRAGRSVEWFVLASLAIFLGAVLAAWYGLSALGFALVPLGVCLGAAATALGRLRDAPFGRKPRRIRLPRVLSWAADAAIFACGVLAIDGSWPHRLFPPLVLLGALHVAGRGSRLGWARLPEDRAVLTAVLAAAAGFGLAEPAVMAATLLLIALDLAETRPKRG